MNIITIGVILSIVFASMKVAGVASMAAWTWIGIFCWPIGIAILIQFAIIVLIALIAACH